MGATFASSLHRDGVCCDGICSTQPPVAGRTA